MATATTTAAVLVRKWGQLREQKQGEGGAWTPVIAAVSFVVPIGQRP